MAAEAGVWVHSTAEVSPDAVIGAGTRVWHQAQVREGAVIGSDCVIGKGVYIDRDVRIGCGVKIQNGVSVYRGVVLEDEVFVGPEATFTNDQYPRAFSATWEVAPTLVRRGASIGANATIVCGRTVGEYSLVAAGAVVTCDVPPGSLVAGNPARVIGEVGRDGRPLSHDGNRAETGRVATAPPGDRPAPGITRSGGPAREGAVRIGVIGAGQMGKNHMRLLSSLGRDVVLAGVADSSDPARREAARLFNITARVDYRQLLEDVDAVVVAVPTQAHHEVAMACLEAGRHVLLEKPLAATAAEAAALAAEARRRGLVLLPGHVERFNPAVGELAGALAGAGRVIGIEARRLSPFSGRGLDMDVVADLMLHDLDIILSLVDSRVVSCQAAGGPVFSERVDYAAATLAFENGLVASFVASRVTQEKVRRLEATAEEGFFALDFLDRKLVITRGATSRHEGPVYRQRSRLEIISVPNAEPLRLELEHFVSCVRGEADPLIAPEEGAAVLGLIEKIQECCTLSLSPE